MAKKFNKLSKRFNKLPLLYKIVIILIFAIAIKCLVTYLTKNVESLTNKKLLKKLKKKLKKKQLIYFHWEKCGHCKDFNPIWDEFSANYKGPLELKKIETKDAGELTKRFGVNGYPTVILVDEMGKKNKEFKGKRTVESLDTFAK